MLHIQLSESANVCRFLHIQALKRGIAWVHFGIFVDCWQGRRQGRDTTPSLPAGSGTVALHPEH